MINYKPKKKNNNKPYDNKCAIEDKNVQQDYYNNNINEIKETVLAQKLENKTIDNNETSIHLKEIINDK